MPVSLSRSPSACCGNPSTLPLADGHYNTMHMAVKCKTATHSDALARPDPALPVTPVSDQKTTLLKGYRYFGSVLAEVHLRPYVASA